MPEVLTVLCNHTANCITLCHNKSTEVLGVGSHKYWFGGGSISERVVHEDGHEDTSCCVTLGWTDGGIPG